MVSKMQTVFCSVNSFSDPCTLNLLHGYNSMTPPQVFAARDFPATSHIHSGNLLKPRM